MKNNIKNQRLSGLFYRLLLKNIFHLKDPIWKKINISSLKISDNGQKYFIFYTCFEMAETTAEKFLIKNVGTIKKIMSKNWPGRSLPDFRFIYDKSLINGEKVQAILNQIQKNE